MIKKRVNKSSIENKKMTSQAPSPKMTLRKIQNELKKTVGYDGQSKFESDFTTIKGKKVEKLMSPRKVSSAISAGFNAAKRKVKGQESRSSLLQREKAVKSLLKNYRPGKPK